MTDIQLETTIVLSNTNKTACPIPGCSSHGENQYATLVLLEIKMAKSLSKRLSFNGRPHSSGKSQNSRDWQNTTHIRSFSGVMAAVEKTAPRAETIENQSEKLIKTIKKNQRRIDKAKKLIVGPETEGNADLYAETRRKILKWEGVVSKCTMLLRQRNAEKLKIDEREETKAKNREKKQSTGFSAHHRLDRSGVINDAIQHRSNKLTRIVKDYKKSTSRNPVYKEESREKAEAEFKKLLKGE